MKISLNLNRHGRGNGTVPGKLAEQDITAFREGDWEARARVENAFGPLLSSMARQRSSDVALINRYIEAGKRGLLAAARKYKPCGDSDRYQILALGIIEQHMDRVTPGKGFFARLFGGK